jgi:CRP-like cAMP-binding protein
MYVVQTTSARGGEEKLMDKKTDIRARANLDDADRDRIAASSLFAGTSPQELASLLQCLNCRKNSYAKGDWIFRAGNRISAAGLLLSGSAHIERYDYWGNRHIVSAIRPGDLFGESYAASPKSVMNVSVQADENLGVLFLDLSRVLHVCSSNCPFHVRLIENLVTLLARRNLLLNEKLTYVTQHTLRDKILSYLSAESIRQHSSYFDIPFDRQQLADYLNAERSALSGELAKLKKEVILDFQKNHFRLIVPMNQDEG